MPDCDETTNLTVYRLVQEGLTNAFRHSGATQIDVAVSLCPDASVLEDGTTPKREIVEIGVHDNGHGRLSTSTDGFGLRAMRERVTALSGSLSILSESGVGTNLNVRLPAMIQKSAAATA
jgi:two-component system sensor histidine kinase UhpB